jgi:putative hydrolase of the HAD superfamily
MFDDVRVLLWDLDGTLYKSVPELDAERWRVDVGVITKIFKIPYEKAYNKLIAAKKKYKSITKSMSILGCGSPIAILKQVEPRINRARYLSYDLRLVRLFNKLVGYRHFIFSNILTNCIPPVLRKLGLKLSTFESFITTQETDLIKPDINFFKYALSVTGFSPSQHLVIGDRVEVDLLPAKKLGMKTCLVWGKSDLVDVSLPDVYSLGNILLRN